MRLIDADALMNDINRSINAMTNIGVMVDGDWLWAKLNDALETAPTVEERKTGKWIYVRTEPDGNAFYYCSECGKGEVHVPIVEVKYCWNCGARMVTEDASHPFADSVMMGD